MPYSFFALVSRMKNIARWSLMRNSSQENVQEHSHMVAVVAHALAVIRRDVLLLDADPGRAAAAALFHDAPEIFTGDMPTPVKYHNPGIISAYKQVEALASSKLLATLPESMRPAYEPLFAPEDEVTLSLIKAADKLCAYIKCLEELKAGNNEFRSAASQTLAKLKALGMPEVDYFMEHFIGAFELTLDELDFSV
ncbi:5'-deoxynucleotidase [Sporobacter termitidis DSM 10068]|uniref:5'-deoxynucleotidase n=1 Tax=Sporobacter termitidis DSM 10068 TaxID=1123282 RepID=A0A1M5YGW6_9FIRM|nr:5'-deoxynucleotidase [Sporobacter termitidis]SHI11212.1 5'-deoxynucleotidase [Sporobacter termitidis DSM 10068]